MSKKDQFTNAGGTGLENFLTVPAKEEDKDIDPYSATIFYTAEELAEMLKVGIRSIYNYIDKGELGASKVGRSWRISGENLKEFLQSNSN